MNVSKLKKGVLLAAGLGTRLVPYSKEMPKEMLPIFEGLKGRVFLKPIIQKIYEQLYDAGVREFCFIVGRGKRAIEDHFTPDWAFVEYLERNGKEEYSSLLREFYSKVESSYIAWVNQPVPRGTAHAVYMAKTFVGDDFFFAAAADNVFIGENVPQKLAELHEKRSTPILAVKRVNDPRKYGIIIGREIEDRIYEVEGIVEKPKTPISNLANTSLYVFPPEIFKAIEETKPSVRGEIEITDSIQILLSREIKFLAYESQADWVDTGTWETFFRAIALSLKHSGGHNIVFDVLEALREK
ncbi:hypothetical protein MA03_01480 [Infirmifilum uzonense]|jgi:UTP--glucose-1-phosphate uridylyltransferase|uniref:UTP--glucose-1-phosphate uridylyltransferase n=1 Tax=Infirmifilum uzonense TaxID=1550241 RepID=A0A0F7FJ12_9CREN|nr:hypothetical protein MA03_01480 [Infirmifilum uzonense]